MQLHEHLAYLSEQRASAVPDKELTPEELRSFFDRQLVLGTTFKAEMESEGLVLSTTDAQVILYEPYFLSETMFDKHDMDIDFPADLVDELSLALQADPNAFIKQKIELPLTMPEYISAHNLDITKHRILDIATKHQEYFDEFTSNKLKKYLSTLVGVDKAYQFTKLLNPDSSDALLQLLEKTQRRMLEISYFAQTLQTATQELITLLPSLKHLILEESQKILFAKKITINKQDRWGNVNEHVKNNKNEKPIAKNASNNDGEKQENRDMLHWGMLATEELNVLIINNDIPTYSEGHYNRIIYIAHELMHAVLYRSFAFKKKYLSKTKSENESKENNANVVDVIEEGIAITCEQELVKIFLSQTIDEGEKLRLRKLAKERLRYLYQVAGLWSEKARKIWVGNNVTGIPDTSKIRAITYSEGVRLALRLRKNGWMLQDLPELIYEIRTIVKEIATSQGETIHADRIQVGRNEKYFSFREKIKRLKKFS